MKFSLQLKKIQTERDIPFIFSFQLDYVKHLHINKEGNTKNIQNI